MLFIIYCVFVVAVTVGANARRLPFNEYGMPIQVVVTSTGQGNLERIDYLEAEIHPRHLTTRQRVSFPTDPNDPVERYFQAIKAPGDERGHLVASQFSGPPRWYNLSPQSPRVNRNLGFQALTTDWFRSECEVRQFLQLGGNRYVKWMVTMTYVGNSNRPHDYHLQVNFVENGRITHSIDTHMRNAFLGEKVPFQVCRRCGSNNCPGH